MKIRKFRPNAEVEYSNGNDGRDGHYYIAFYCPNCGREINQGYKSETACNRCGTFYDWGTSRPTIEIIREVRWD